MILKFGEGDHLAWKNSVIMDSKYEKNNTNIISILLADIYWAFTEC